MASADALPALFLAVGSLLPTLACNAALLLGSAWLVERCWLRRHPARAELLWRAALLASLLSLLAPTLSLLADRGPAAAATDFAAASSAPALHAPGAPAANAGPGLGAGSATAIAGAAPAGPATHAPAGGRPPLHLSLSAPLQRGLGAGWLAGCGASLALLLLGVLRLRRLPRGLPAPPVVQAAAGQLAARFGIAPPRLLCSGRLSSALALPRRTILLPAWALALPPAQLQALLAHELWHLRRRDPRWRVLQRLLLAPLFFHPFAWLAQRRLDALAEAACDTAAAGLSGSGRPLAECLAACLAHAQRQPGASTPRLALAITNRPGAVVQRVRHLLEETTPMNDAAVPSRWLRAGTLSLAVAAALALPVVAVTGADAAGERRNISVLVDADGRQRVDLELSDAGRVLEVELDGKVQFTDGEDGVAALGDGDELDISEQRDGVLRRVLFEGSGGQVQRTLWIDGAQQAFDARTDAWLATLLPQVLRETGIDAGPRAKRLLRRGGADALLAEIALIESDHVRGTYLALLLAQPGLQPAQLDRALQLAAAMGSDFERRRSLEGVLDGSPDAATVARVLQASAAFGSDFELRTLLERAAGHLHGDPALQRAWHAGAQRLGSDFERRTALLAFLAAAPPDRAASHAVLESAAGIGSDFETAQVLRALAAVMPADAALIAEYRKLARRLSAHERGQVEQALDRFATL